MHWHCNADQPYEAVKPQRTGDYASSVCRFSLCTLGPLASPVLSTTAERAFAVLGVIKMQAGAIVNNCDFKKWVLQQD